MLQVILVDELLKVFSRRVRSKHPIFLAHYVQALISCPTCCWFFRNQCLNLIFYFIPSDCSLSPGLTISAKFYDSFLDQHPYKDPNAHVLILQFKFRLSESEPTICYQRVRHGSSSCSSWNCKVVWWATDNEACFFRFKTHSLDDRLSSGEL